MSQRHLFRLVALPVLVLALACSGQAAAKPATSASSAADQLAFGSRMAERGLWSEALFRFQQAGQIDPQNARAWNNLAVAQEATGKFDEALASYKKALELAPDNPEIKRNYARFVEFYQSFKPRPADQPAAAEAQPQGRDES